ncbi:transposable element Tcb2 transposase [Trichonephila clavipes]|nr:transposable element Tcb2 transposase [Trichonephila clavipes]
MSAQKIFSLIATAQRAYRMSKVIGHFNLRLHSINVLYQFPEFSVRKKVQKSYDFPPSRERNPTPDVLAPFRPGTLSGHVEAELREEKSLKVGVETSGSERCPLHEDQGQDVLDRAVVKKTVLFGARARGHWTAVEWNQVVFSDKFRFNLSCDDNRVRVWRPRGERPNPAFALQRHTAPTAGVKVSGAIAYNTRSPLVLIRGTMTAQQYTHDIFQPHVLSLMKRLPGAIFQQDNDRPHTARVS